MRAHECLTRVALVTVSLALGLGAAALGAPVLQEPTQPLNVPAHPAPATDSIPDIYYFARGNNAFAGIDIDRLARNGITIALADSAPAQDRQRLRDDIVDHVPSGTTIDFRTCSTSLEVLQATDKALSAVMTTGRLRADGVVTTEQGLCTINITTTKPLIGPATADLRTLFPQPFVIIAQGPGVTFQSS